MKRLRIGVIYGGRSGEHEVSQASAAAVIANLDPAKYEIRPIYIDRDGHWSLPAEPPRSVSAADTITRARLSAATSITPPTEVQLVPRPGGETLLTIDRASLEAGRVMLGRVDLDLVFPVLHGPNGEDGTVQGLLELANVPYVGAGVAASAVGMDKVLMKRVFASCGLPLAEYTVVKRRDWLDAPEATLARLLETLPLPLFVKPANLGSSVGISKARTPEELGPALALAAEYDRKVVVEAGVPEAREIECAVLGNDRPEVSVPGEIVPSGEFYDYDAKYLSDGSTTIIPAVLDLSHVRMVQDLAAAAFVAVDCAGLARVDFLLSRSTGRLVVNEINTMPGFTTISMFAKLWAASGLTYPQLLDRLVALALERHAEKQPLRTTAL